MGKSALTPEQVSEFLASRRSTRDFIRDKPVPRELLDQLLTDALTAPSWSNTRPFIIAIADGQVRDRISQEFLNRWAALCIAKNGNLIDKAKLLITRFGLPTSNRSMSKPYVKELKPRASRVGKELYELLGINRKDVTARDAAWAKNYEFFGAPTELFIYIHKSLGIWSASDAGLMMQNFILSAHAHGLGTCAQGAVAIWDDVVRSEFEISSDYRLLTGLAIGYPSDAPVNSFQADRIGFQEIIASEKSASEKSARKK
jgi:nitroreductase